MIQSSGYNDYAKQALQISAAQRQQNVQLENPNITNQTPAQSLKQDLRVEPVQKTQPSPFNVLESQQSQNTQQLTTLGSSDRGNNLDISV